MNFFRRHIRTATSVFAIVLFGGYYFAFSPPANFPSGSVISIVQGTSASDIAQELGRKHIIAHPTVLRFLVRISGAKSVLRAGTYRFETPQNVFTVAYRLMTGAYDLPLTRITFPEGATVRDMAQQVADAFPGISAADFSKAAQPYEGYLFPDTYLFQSGTDADAIVKALRANFTAKTASLSGEMSVSEHSLFDTVVVASLVEKEARSSANKRIVAGILWNRLARGMPLQVDAVFGYIYGRDTYSPSLADLAVDSPYNTYTHTGLPPGPIDNPGLDSLAAAASPAATTYLYYLTGKDGLMHYATTFAGHQSNRRKYLD